MASGVPKAVKALSNGSPDTRVLAAEKLRSLAASSEAAQCEIIAEGAARPLVSLLIDGIPQGRAVAARVLMDLSSAGPRREVIFAAGAVPPLVDLLASGALGIEDAVGALASLAASDGIRAAIVRAGAVPHLVALLSSGQARGQARAGTAVAALAAKEECREAMLKAGVLVPLLVLLELDTGDEMSRTAAARAVGSLAGSNAGRKAVSVAGGIPLLVGLLRCGDDEKAAAASAIAALAEQDDDEVAMSAAHPVPPLPWEVFSEALVLGPLVSLLAKGSIEGKAQASFALFTIAMKEDSHAEIVAAGALPPLVGILAHGTAAKERGWAAGALRYLATTPANKEAIEAAVPRGQRGREEILRTVQLYCL